MKNLGLIADQLVFVNLDITCWSGKKTLTPEDLGLDRNQLPPDTLVSLGDKQLIDPAALRKFTTLRSSARRHCLAVGTRFMGGYAAPAAKAQTLLQKLGELEQSYNAARSAFLSNYDDQLAIWAAQQPPQWQKLIRDALVPAEYVGGRLKFAVQAVRFEAPDPQVVDHPGLSDAIAGLGGQVFHEIAQLAREALEKSFQGKGEVTRKALNPFKAIRDKLDGLSFMDGRFQAVIREIDRLLMAVPAKPPIAGIPLDQLRQFLCLASQPAGLRAFAENAGMAVEAVFIGLDSDPEYDRDAGTPVLDSSASDGDAEPDWAVGFNQAPVQVPSPCDEPEESEEDTPETVDTASDEDTGWFF